MGQMPDRVRLIERNEARVLGRVPALMKCLRRERACAMVCGMIASRIVVGARGLRGVS